VTFRVIHSLILNIVVISLYIVTHNLLYLLLPRLYRERLFYSFYSIIPTIYNHKLRQQKYYDILNIVLSVRFASHILINDDLVSSRSTADLLIQRLLQVDDGVIRRRGGSVGESR
jgi:hypothetical protein